MVPVQAGAVWLCREGVAEPLMSFQEANLALPGSVCLASALATGVAPGHQQVSGCFLMKFYLALRAVPTAVGVRTPLPASQKASELLLLGSLSLAWSPGGGLPLTLSVSPQGSRSHGVCGMRRSGTRSAPSAQELRPLPAQSPGVQIAEPSCRVRAPGQLPAAEAKPEGLAGRYLKVVVKQRAVVSAKERGGRVVDQRRYGDSGGVLIKL